MRETERTLSRFHARQLLASTSDSCVPIRSARFVTSGESQVALRLGRIAYHIYLIVFRVLCNKYCVTRGTRKTQRERYQCSAFVVRFTYLLKQRKDGATKKKIMQSVSMVERLGLGPEVRELKLGPSFTSNSSKFHTLKCKSERKSRGRNSGSLDPLFRQC